MTDELCDCKQDKRWLWQQIVCSKEYQALEREGMRVQAIAAKAAARALLDICAEQQFGSGEALRNAEHYLREVADQLGFMLVPSTVKRTSRRQISKAKTRATWDRDGWKCKHCGTNENLTVDHIIALVNGGTDDLENLQTLCGSCNSSKGAR